MCEIPGKALVKINQKVGFRFVTKFGEKGLINIGKMVPVVGALINGGLDYAETKVIANRAYKMFMLNDFSDDNMSSDKKHSRHHSHHSHHNSHHNDHHHYRNSNNHKLYDRHADIVIDEDGNLVE